MSSAVVALSLAAMLLQAQPKGLPDPIVDNDRVTVWDVTWHKDTITPVQQRRDDVVLICLNGGPMKVKDPNGTIGAINGKIGDVIFEAASSASGGPGACAGNPPRSIVIELKDHPATPLPNKSGYPNAFPRPGVKKVFENNRVIAWDYTWISGVPTPMHSHDKDVIVVYLEEGALKSTTLDGKSVINPNSFGSTKFNARDRIHTEELIRGKDRAIIVELK